MASASSLNAEKATRVPADLIGRDDLGRIAPGAVADLAWLGDDLDAIATWVGGTLVWPSPARLEELAGPRARPARQGRA